MKLTHNRFYLLAILLLSLTVLQSCADKTVRTYMANSPIYQSMEDWRATDFQIEGPRNLEHPGKIYVYGRYLFVNEFMRGVHIFDNGNPASPINLGFLPIMSNADMAINNNILYVDTYMDLLAFDITNPTNPQLMHRVEDVFEFSNWGMVEGYDPNYPAQQVDSDQGILIGWEINKVTEEVTTRYMNGLDPRAGFADLTSSNEAATNISGAGIGGSMARFTIWENHLYALQWWELDVFDLNGEPNHVRRLQMDRNCETLFPAEGRLYIGTTTGMLIYSLNNPDNPTFISAFDHWASCDPVVVQDDKAFVTLSSGTTCQGDVDVLQVVDISTIQNPTLVSSYDMENPKGLGVDGDLLFLCDGPAGLKIFDKSDLTDIASNRISHFPDLVAYDVIPVNGTLIMTSEEGIFQYDYSNPQNIVQLSHLPAFP